MVICLERGANDLHMVQLMLLPPRHLLLQQNPEWFILLVPAYPGCPGKKAVRQLCVCVYLWISDAVRRNRIVRKSTTSDIETVVKLWLRYAGDRSGGRKERLERKIRDEALESDSDA